MKYTLKNTIEVGEPKRVFLDGEEVDGVIECDTEKGYVIHHKVDDDGNLVLKRGEIATEKEFGIVTVKPEKR